MAKGRRKGKKNINRHNKESIPEKMKVSLGRLTSPTTHQKRRDEDERDRNQALI